MKYKSDWSQAQQRLTALWNAERLDRPCIAVRAPQSVEMLTSLPVPVDDEARWLDPTYRVALAQRELESTWWGGEAVPLLPANGGVDDLSGWQTEIYAGHYLV